jgi:ribosomal protein S18 acetylase RimI-like enzyme
MPVPYQLTVEPDPPAELVELIRHSLRTFNRQQVGYRDDTNFAVFLRDEQNELKGGMLCWTLWQWLTIDWLWLDETVRGQGFGSQLLLLAEEEGRKRGCLHGYVETLSFQAPGFYQKHGYEIVGELQDFPAGHSRFFLRKKLT